MATDFIVFIHGVNNRKYQVINYVRDVKRLG
jgi:hypothetical protein